MQALQQRLKELDREHFEQMCFHLLKERYPGIDIRHVNGASGDEGIDHFTGDLDGEPVIWQCKQFANGVGKSQKAQIKKSLNTALEKFRPREWVLCLSTDMDIKAHRWFQQLAHSRVDDVTVKLMQGSDILHELIYRKSIRDVYFPGAVLETSELRALIAKTDGLSNDELVAIAAENVDQLIERLKAHDARFAYEVSFTKDVKPILKPPVPGLVASVTHDNRTINVYARDTEAINRNPPKGTFTLSGDGAAKLQELIKTGKAQHLTPDECIDFTSDLSFLGPRVDGRGLELHIGPALTQPRQKLNLRLTFGNSGAPIVYDLVPFDIGRAGTEESELVSRGSLPFKFSIVVRTNPTAVLDFKVNYKIVGTEVRAMKKFIAAMDSLGKSGAMEFFDLDRGTVLFTLVARAQEIADFDVRLRNLVDDAALVAEHYGVELIVPSKITGEDHKALTLLVELARGTTRAVNNISMTVTKVMELTPELQKTLSAPASFLIRQPEVLPRPVLFGVEVPTGVVLHHLENAILRNPKAYKARFAKAQMGRSLRISLIPKSPLKISALGKAGPSAG